MWLVAHNRCWTADRLAKKGLAHLEKCPLCDQEEETINHLLLSCVFARQTWFEILLGLGLQVLSPQLEDPSFEELEDPYQNMLGLLGSDSYSAATAELPNSMHTSCH